MKKIKLLAICMAIILLFVGCGNASDESKPTSIDDENKKNQNESNDEEKDDYLSARMNLLSYSEGEYPNDTVVVSVIPTEATYLDGGAGGYVPKNQDEWKVAISNATEHLQDMKYEVFPWEDMLPISISWVHDGLDDVWSLNKDGSLWGYHSYNDELFTNNYIAPEDAKPIVDLIMQVYDYLRINPIEPEEIRDIACAELVIKGKSYFLKDEASLKILEETLKNGKFVPGGTGCIFQILKLSLKNGENISVAVAVDGCGIWHSDGIYYDYGSEKARDVFSLFGLSWDDLD